MLHVRDKNSVVREYSHPDVPIAVTFRRFRKGQSFRVGGPRRENVLTLLSGDLEAATPVEVRLQRRSVFEDEPVALYIGAGQSVLFRATQNGELVVVGAPAKRKGPIRALASCGERRGRPGYERWVHNLVTHEFPAERLLVGETLNEPGNWSSFPPHKHDRQSKVESKLQEVYFFKLAPEDGFGFMRLYDDRRMDTALTIRNNDLVWIPRGYHPVAAMPGYRLYYLWALAGEGRELKWNTDPRYRWLL